MKEEASGPGGLREAVLEVDGLEVDGLEVDGLEEANSKVVASAEANLEAKEEVPIPSVHINENNLRLYCIKNKDFVSLVNWSSFLEQLSIIDGAFARLRASVCRLMQTFGHFKLSLSNTSESRVK